MDELHHLTLRVVLSLGWAAWTAVSATKHITKHIAIEESDHWDCGNLRFRWFGTCLKLRIAVPLNVHIKHYQARRALFTSTLITTDVYFIAFASVTLSPPGVRPMELAVSPLPASSILIGIKFRSRMPFHVKGIASTDISWEYWSWTQACRFRMHVLVLIYHILY